MQHTPNATHQALAKSKCAQCTARALKNISRGSYQACTCLNDTHCLLLYSVLHTVSAAHDMSRVPLLQTTSPRSIGGKGARAHPRTAAWRSA